MSTQKLDTEIRKEQIVQAALDLIGNHGIQALCMAGIAERVGLVPSGIYRHFKGKDELLNATLDLIEKKLLDNISRACREAPDALERLQRLLMHEIRLLLEHQAIPHVVFSEGVFAGSPERKAKMRAIITGYFREVEKIVVQGQQEGRIRKDVSPRTVALMFKGMVLPAIVLWRVTDGGIDLVRHAQAAWDLFRTAVAPPPKDPENRSGHEEEA